MFISTPSQKVTKIIKQFIRAETHKDREEGTIVHKCPEIFGRWKKMKQG